MKTKILYRVFGVGMFYPPFPKASLFELDGVLGESFPSEEDAIETIQNCGSTDVEYTVIKIIERRSK